MIDIDIIDIDVEFSSALIYAVALLMLKHVLR